MKPRTLILHSEADEVVPFEDTRELIRNSRLDESHIVAVGSEHRLADSELLQALLTAVEQGARG